MPSDCGDHMAEASVKQIKRFDAKATPIHSRNFPTGHRHRSASVMIHDELPEAGRVGKLGEVGTRVEPRRSGVARYLIGRKAGEQIPATGIKGKDFDGPVVVWIHPEGKASLFKDGKLALAGRSESSTARRRHLLLRTCC